MSRTRIKFCGITGPDEIIAVNLLKPDYIGFVFARKSTRYVDPSSARVLKNMLDPSVRTVGVFVNEFPEEIAELLNTGLIDAAQLHGDEDDEYIRKLKNMTDRPIIRAYRIHSEEEIRAAAYSTADQILLDSGAGTGTVFDWSLLEQMDRPYFLAGGLNPENAGTAVRMLRPWGLDVSTGIETEHKKDYRKMKAFIDAVRKEERDER